MLLRRIQQQLVLLLNVIFINADVSVDVLPRGAHHGFGGAASVYSHAVRYRGDALTTLHSSPMPTVNSSDIARALIGDRANDSKTISVVRDSSFTLKNLTYYWNETLLPNNWYGPSHCQTASFKFANVLEKQHDFTTSYMCSFSEPKKCKRGISILAEHLTRNVSFTNGTRASSLFWECPPSTDCCGWECCREDERLLGGDVQMGVAVLAGIFTFLLLAMLVIMIAMACSSRKSDGKLENKKEVEEIIIFDPLSRQCYVLPSPRVTIPRALIRKAPTYEVIEVPSLIRHWEPSDRPPVPVHRPLYDDPATACPQPPPLPTPRPVRRATMTPRMERKMSYGSENH